MSAMRCNQCERIVDTDEDLDSLYVVDGQCICEFCRDETDDDAIDGFFHTPRSRACDM